MIFYERWVRMWFGIPASDITPDDVNTSMNNAYQLGFQNGVASGELRGRQMLLQEIEIALAARGRTLADIEPEEIAAQKTKVVH